MSGSVTRRFKNNKYHIRTGLTRGAVDSVVDGHLSDNFQPLLSEGAFEDGDKTKLDGVEAGADVTDADNVEDAITGSAAVTDPTDAGVFPVIISGALKKIPWASIKSVLTTALQSVFALASHAEEHDPDGSDPITVVHANTSDRSAADAHPDSAITDPAVTTLTPSAGAVTIAASSTARRFAIDLGSDTTLTATVTGLTNGGEAVFVEYENSGAGVTWTWSDEATVASSGTAPAAAGDHELTLRRNKDGVLVVRYLPELTIA